VTSVGEIEEKANTRNLSEPRSLVFRIFKVGTFLQKAISRQHWAIILAIFCVAFCALDLLFVVDYGGV